MDSKLSLNGDQYMKLLITQLENQNPMDPMDNGKMLAQMSDMATLESTNKLQNSFDSVLELVNLTGGASLVGRDVEYFNGAETAQGTVDSVSVENEELKANLGDTSVSLSEIKRVL